MARNAAAAVLTAAAILTLSGCGDPTTGAGRGQTTVGSATTGAAATSGPGVTTGSSTTSAASAAAGAICSVLTPADVTAVFGGTGTMVDPTVAVRDGAMSCQVALAGTTFGDDAYVVWGITALDAEDFRASTAQRVGAGVAADAPGIGEAGYYDATDTVVFLRSAHVYSLQASTDSTVVDDQTVKDAVLKLGGVFASKL